MSRYGYLEVFQRVPWNSRYGESTVFDDKRKIFILKAFRLKTAFEPGHRIIYKTAGTSSQDSDETVYPRSLCRIFCGYLKCLLADSKDSD